MKVLNNIEMSVICGGDKAARLARRRKRQDERRQEKQSKENMKKEPGCNCG